MKKFHLGNINFEWELKTRSTLCFQKAFQVHPNFLQLQFLPLLYADEGDEILVTHLPKKDFQQSFRLHLLSAKTINKGKLETWGWSENGKKWADKRGITYDPPPLPKVRDIASKAFSFTHSSTLPGAQLFHTMKELEKWIKKGPYPKVLKTCFGLAGRGRFLLATPEEFVRTQTEISKAFKEGHPLIGEPWVERLFDFSTQWLISKDGKASCLGATVMENKNCGQYERTLAGDEETLFGHFYLFLKEHLEKIKMPMQRIINEGYFGNLGIDAMVYRHPTKMTELLHPIVEFNARKTLGYLALKLLKKQQAPFLSLSYASGNTPGLLPQELFLSDKEKISFRKQLKTDIFESWTR